MGSFEKYCNGGLTIQMQADSLKLLVLSLRYLPPLI